MHKDKILDYFRSNIVFEKLHCMQICEIPRMGATAIHFTTVYKDTITIRCTDTTLHINSDYVKASFHLTDIIDIHYQYRQVELKKIDGFSIYINL